MKSHWGIAAAVTCVALTCGVAITWHFAGTRAIQRKLVNDAKACQVRADQGDAKAQYDLARLYYQGKGVKQDYAQAVALYRKAADQGDAKAQYGVGFMYDEGKGVSRDYGQAVAWYRKAADEGNAKAQYALAFMYQEGKGVPQDSTAAMDWCRKAADQGYAKAQYGLGNTYYEGKEVPQSYAEAVLWYGKAADQGYAEAQSELGYMFAEGKGMPQDYNEAVRWYRKAADQGYAKGQDGLGYAYFHGMGVPQDYVEGARWFRKAAKQGDEYARRALDAMNVHFGARSKINLLVVVLGSLLLLVRSRGSIRNQPLRKTTVLGLLGLSWVGLDAYGYSHLGLLLSLSMINVFYFGKGLLAGVSGAMLIFFAPRKTAKAVLGGCGVLFIGFNIYAINHYDLRHLPVCPRPFYSMNGLLIGAAITSAIALWVDANKAPTGQNGRDGEAPATVAGNQTEPLQI
jgi:TPR repeat protein